MASSEAMDERQLEKPSSYRLARQIPTRSLSANIGAVLLQPATFFRALPPMRVTRQWLWVGLLILGLIGFGAVRRDMLGQEAATSNSGIVERSEVQVDPSLGGEGIVDPGLGGGDFGIVPPPTPDTSSSMDTSTAWTTALVAASSMIFGWFIQMLLLSEVSLLKGTAPRLSQNAQIAIWASVPLGLMALLQLIYQFAGGTIGKAGLSGLVVELPFYATLPTFPQNILLSLASNLTLFWLWSLVLMYFGARYALQGKRWSAALVVVSWIIVLTILPVATGILDITEESAINPISGESISPDMLAPDGGLVEMTLEATVEAFDTIDMTPQSQMQSETTESAPHGGKR